MSSEKEKFRDMTKMRKRSSIKVAEPRARFIPDDRAIAVPPLFLHMFEQDVRLSVAPIGGRRFSRDFRAVFGGEAGDQKRARALFARLTDTTYRDVEGSVAESIQQIAASMLNDGAAVFEILPAEDDEEKDLFALHLVQPEHLYRSPFGCIQIIPRTDWTKDEPRFVFIAKHRMCQFRLPKELGGRFRFLRMRRVLSRITGFPAFTRHELSKGEFKTAYDALDFRRLLRSTVLRATRTWGWIGRDHSLDYETEFYLAYRQITFAWATAILREAIVGQFNKLYRQLGIGATLRLEGLLTPDEILEIRRQFTVGEIDLAKAFERLRKERLADTE